MAYAVAAFLLLTAIPGAALAAIRLRKDPDNGDD